MNNSCVLLNFHFRPCVLRNSKLSVNLLEILKNIYPQYFFIRKFCNKILNPNKFNLKLQKW